MVGAIIFIPQEAEAYGVNEAIMIQHFRFWINKNIANGKNHYQGRTWTYNSMTAFCEIFPFWTRRQIERILKNMVDKQIIVKDNFNSNKNDRTIWYAFFSEKRFIYGEKDEDEKPSETAENPISPKREMKETADSSALDTCKKEKNAANPQESSFHQTVNSISPNGEMHFTKRGNVYKGTDKIPDIKKEGAYAPVNISLKQWEVTEGKMSISHIQRFVEINHLDEVKVQKRIDAFRSWHQQHGTLRADWLETLRGWLHEHGKDSKGLQRLKKAREEEPILPMRTVEPETHQPMQESLRLLQKRIGEVSFNSWLAELRFHKEEGGIVTLAAKSGFIRDYVHTRYHDEVRKALQATFHDMQGFDIIVIASNRQIAEA